MSENDYEAYEAIEARHLAEALDALEAGADPGIDPREDPELSAQIETVRAVRELHLEATRQPSFATYVRRSGAFIQQQLRQERAPQPLPRPVTAVAEPVKAGRVHFLFRWSTLAPVTSAAAAAAIVLAFVVLNSSSPASSPPTEVTQPQLPVPEAPLTEETSPLRVPAPDPDPGLAMLERMALAESLIGEQRALVSRSAEDELLRIRTILDEIAAANARGELVADALLLEFTRGSADLALRIRTTPESVSRETVIGYIETAGEGQTVLGQAEAAEGSEGTLHIARLTTQDGVVVAARYLFRSQVPVAPSE